MGKRDSQREVLDTFKAVAMTEEDLKDEHRTRVTQKTVAERTWYTPEAWEHGGLRIKNEVKDEAGMDVRLHRPRNSRRRRQSNSRYSCVRDLVVLFRVDLLFRIAVMCNFIPKLSLFFNDANL